MVNTLTTRTQIHPDLPNVGVLNVALGTRSYLIYIGENILDHPLLWQNVIRGKQLCVVTNETIAPLYLDKLTQLLTQLNVQLTTVILPDGEKYKHLTTLEQIFNALLTARHARDTTLIALGGGVIGDMTGFAAACYQRGVAFIQVPTTLLSQVDSSVGGKTGVNHPLGKNMLGAFHQPQMVLADTATLKTLPPRELAAGLAEVVKYGLLGDFEFLVWLENNIQPLLNCESDALQTAIARSCQNKADIVARDEHETGERALLNLGHTFGHAIETFTRYETWLHGEAVGAGMAMAADFSAYLGWISAEDATRAKKLIAAFGLPTTPPEHMRASDFLHLMTLDKKVKNGQVRLVLFEKLGKAVLTADYDGNALQGFLTQYCGA